MALDFYILKRVSILAIISVCFLESYELILVSISYTCFCLSLKPKFNAAKLFINVLVLEPASSVH